jgi:molybdopterin-guanine dinucleotide biosynthesis protein A
MLHRAVLRVAEACPEVVVVLSPGAPEPVLPAAAAARFARDAAEGMGPLAGVAAGLHAARSELALVVGGDMPDLQVPVLLEMVRAADGPVAAVALRDAEGLRPLPCVLRVAAALEVAGPLLRSGGRRLRDLLAELRVEAVDEGVWRALDPVGRTLVDIDEPADLDRS